MAPRYLSLSELDRWLTAEMLRACRPRAARVRAYVPDGDMADLAAVVRQYLALDIA